MLAAIGLVHLVTEHDELGHACGRTCFSDGVTEGDSYETGLVGIKDVVRGHEGRP
jgi:hypothetical protein